MSAEELKDYYKLLGVPKTVGTHEIHKAYWQRASRCHPDKGGSHEAMVQIVEAWKILSDPVKRARYDQLLNSRPERWRNKKFDEDVLDAQKRAETYAQSWAEFEDVYQKAFYTFNQDFYGADPNIKVAGPYSPLMTSKVNESRNKSDDRNNPVLGVPQTQEGKMFDYFFKVIITTIAALFVILWYRGQSNIGRYVPLGQVTPPVQMLDTTNGAVYTMEQRTGTLSSAWKNTIPPFSDKQGR